MMMVMIMILTNASDDDAGDDYHDGDGDGVDPADMMTTMLMMIAVEMLTMTRMNDDVDG